MSTLKYSQTNTKVNTINYSKGVLSSSFICIKPVLFHKHFNNQKPSFAQLTQVGTLVSFPQLSCDSKSKSPFNSNHKSPFIFLEKFWWRNSMAFPTVHDRGRGYSNRFNSAEVVHLCHNNCNSSSGVTGPDLSYAVRELPILTFHLHTLV